MKKIDPWYTPKYKVGDTVYYSSFGEVKSMVVANIVTDSTDNPMYEDENGSAVFEKDLIEQKPAWSEEDEYMLNETIQHLEELIRIDKAKHLGCDVQYYQRDIDWLKSIKERVHPKSQWTDEDEIKRDLVYNALNSIYDIKQSAVLSQWLNRKLKAME